MDHQVQSLSRRPSGESNSQPLAKPQSSSVSSRVCTADSTGLLKRRLQVFIHGLSSLGDFEKHLNIIQKSHCCCYYVLTPSLLMLLPSFPLTCEGIKAAGQGNGGRQASRGTGHSQPARPAEIIMDTQENAVQQERGPLHVHVDGIPDRAHQP